MRTLGKFGKYGGVYVPETLMPALEELEEAFATIVPGDEFRSKLSSLLTDFAGRPTPLYHAKKPLAEVGRASVFEARRPPARRRAQDQ